MPIIEVDMEQLLKTIEKLDSREFEILQEQIHLIQRQKIAQNIIFILT